jgi:hypothetical protein
VANHVVKNVLYVAAKGRVDLAMLDTAGVRGQAAHGLLALITKWQNETEILGQRDQELSGDMELCMPNSDWKPTVFPGAPKYSKVIQESYDQFVHQGKSLASIALNRTKAVQPSTILGHILTATLNGFPVPWQRLMEFLPPKSKFDLCEQHLTEQEYMDPSCALKPLYERMNEQVSYDQLRAYISLKRIRFPCEWKVKDAAQENNPAKRARVV